MLEKKVLSDMIASKLMPIKPWLEDKTVTEIMINPGGGVFVEAAGEVSYKGKLFEDIEIEGAIITVGKMAGRNTNAGRENDPIVYAGIDDLRFSGALAPVSPIGAFITIRKHSNSSERPTLEQLVQWDMLTQEQSAKLENLVLHEPKNMFMVGATGSGKTTLLNALLNKLPEHERVITIEDSREIQLNREHHIPLLVDNDKKITARRLVQLTLRMRPDRLILGETRGEETYDTIRAFNTGHPGNISTIHADSAAQGLSALEMMFQMSLPENASMSESVMRKCIADAVNVVVFVKRSTEKRGEVTKVVRKVTEICIVKGVMNGQYVLENIA